MNKEIKIFGEIGEDVTVKSVEAQLDPNAESYTLRISSIGGNVFDGYAIYNILKNSGKKITTRVEGLCASIATLIAAAGEKIVMNKTSQFMIHNPKIEGLNGDSRELRNTAEQLDKIKNQIVSVYQQKTGLPKERLDEMYDNETWMTADEAMSLKFVDDVAVSFKAVAKIDPKQIKGVKDDSIIGKLKNQISNLLKFSKIKNQMTETLEDGRVIMVMVDEGGEWVGATVALEDGSPLEAGEYTLMSGKTIIIGEGSMISEVREPEAPEAKKDDMKDLEQAQAKIKELEAALAASKTAEAKAKQFQNSSTKRLEEMEAKIKSLEDEPAGDQDAPDLGVRKLFINKDGQPLVDPMAEALIEERKNRGIA